MFYPLHHFFTLMTSLELYVLIGLNVAQLNVNLKSVVNISAAAFVHCWIIENLFKLLFHILGYSLTLSIRCCLDVCVEAGSRGGVALTPVQLWVCDYTDVAVSHSACLWTNLTVLLWKHWHFLESVRTTERFPFETSLIKQTAPSLFCPTSVEMRINIHNSSVDST